MGQRLADETSQHLVERARHRQGQVLALASDLQGPRGTNRVKHRPALALKLVEGYGAIEVETHQRVPARLLGTMNMYDALTDNGESPITGVLFVTKDNVIADQIHRAARKAMLSPPHGKIRSLREIIQQTRTAGWETP
jgi:hypothetical protein